jgi:hypothetical protein
MRAMDILRSRVVGTVNGLLIPIPYGNPSFPEGPACRELGAGVAAMLGDESEPPK